MFPVNFIIPLVPALLVAAGIGGRAVIALRQMKEIRKIREILEANLGPIVVNDKED
jgi:hypothetical protein